MALPTRVYPDRIQIQDFIEDQIVDVVGAKHVHTKESRIQNFNEAVVELRSEDGRHMMYLYITRTMTEPMRFDTASVLLTHTFDVIYRLGISDDNNSEEKLQLDIDHILSRFLEKASFTVFSSEAPMSLIGVTKDKYANAMYHIATFRAKIQTIETGLTYE